MAIKLAKEKPGSHRLCPVLLDETPPEVSLLMLGLSSLQALRVGDAGSIARVAELLTDSQIDESPANTPALVIRLEELLLERERRVDGIGAEKREREIFALADRIRELFQARRGAALAGGVLDRVIGCGNFGTIWLGREPDSGKLVATKVFDLNKLTQGVMLWRFRRSIKAIQQLNRRRDAPPNIVRIREVSDDELAFSMDYLSEGNLENVARRGWTEMQKIEIFLEICRAAEFAHRSGVIHRDIKPANVVMDVTNRPVLTDFDISDIKFVTNLSVASGGLGTPVFAAPEQLVDADAATEHSDVYSLGRLLHFLLLERPPHIQIQEDPDLEELSAFSPALVEVVRKATQIQPAARFPDVAELIRATQRHKTGLALFQARLTRAWRRVRKNKWPLAFLVTLIGILASVAVYQTKVAEREEKLRREIAQASLQMAEWQGLFEVLQQQKDSLRAEVSRLENHLGVLDLDLGGRILTDQERASRLRERSQVEQILKEKRTMQKILDSKLADARREIETERQRLDALRGAPAVSRAVTLQGGRVGESYRSVVLSGLEGHVRWMLESGLPPGLGFAEGVLEGLPTVAGDWTLLLEAMDTHDTRRAITASVSISASPPVRSSANERGSAGTRLSIALPRLPDTSSHWVIDELQGLPPLLSIVGEEIVGVPQLAGRYVLDLEVLDTSMDVRASHTVNLTIDNGACETPDLADCGGHCVSLAGNPFHESECFRITTELQRLSAESGEPPPWLEIGNRPHMYIRLYYAWTEDRRKIQVASFGYRRASVTELGHDVVSELDTSEIEHVSMEIPAEYLSGPNHIFVVGDLAVSCNGRVRVADYRSNKRPAFEKLSTRKTWSRALPKDWSPMLPATTDGNLLATFGSLLDNWRATCGSAGS